MLFTQEHSTHFFENMPMPPSVNKAYSPYGSRLIKTKILRLFDEDMKFWAYKHRMDLYKIGVLLEENSDFCIHIDFTFYFPRDRLFSSSNKIKIMDVSNRIKAIEDSLCKLMGINDSKVFKVSATKTYGSKDRVSAEIKVIGLKFPSQ